MVYTDTKVIGQIFHRLIDGSPMTGLEIMLNAATRHLSAQVQVKFWCPYDLLCYLQLILWWHIWQCFALR